MRAVTAYTGARLQIGGAYHAAGANHHTVRSRQLKTRVPPHIVELRAEPVRRPAWGDQCVGQGQRVSNRNGEQSPPEAPHSGRTVVAKVAVRESMERTLRPDLQTMRGRGTVDRSVLTEKIRSLCQHAHEQGLHAEQVIILIKEMWAELLPPITYEAMREEHNRLSDVVSLTIEEFYGPRNPSA